MNRAELAERLKRSREALGWVFPGQFQELTENLDAAIVCLEKGEAERDVRRWLALCELYDRPRRWFYVDSDRGVLMFERWEGIPPKGLYRNPGEAVDAWIEGGKR